MSEDKKSQINTDLLTTPKQFFDEAVESAIIKRKIKIYPAVKTYLVQLLEHYLFTNNLFEEELVDENGQRKPQTLAEMYLKAGTLEHTEKVNLLKKLGDKSLYISGFFGDSLKKKLVDIDYYAEMGGAAYGALSHVVREDTLAKTYQTFSSRFLDFVEVLNYISQQSMVKSDQSILRLYDRYLRTGSELAREKLEEMGVTTLPKFSKTALKQN